MDDPEVLSPRAVLGQLGHGLDREAVGPLAERPWLFVEVDDSEGLEELTALVPRLPCVLVGVGHPSPAVPAGWFDVLLTPDADPPRPWVGSPRGDRVQLAEAVARSSTAAVTLTQVLRLGETIDVADAIILESIAYGLLQSGPRFGHWLAERGPRPHRSDGTPVLVERADAVLTLTLNRPEVRNAYDGATRDALVDGLRVAQGDPTITRVVLQGNGPSFCAGGDLSEFGTAPDPTVAHLVRTTRGAAALLAELADRVEARVHGPCIGAGVELAAFAARVDAAADATFALPEVGMGLIPGAGGTASVPRRIGRHRAAWLALSGEAIDATTAAAWGLVDRVR